MSRLSRLSRLSPRGAERKRGLEAKCRQTEKVARERPGRGSAELFEFPRFVGAISI
jgi:hypothetical protein